MEDLNSND